MTINRQDNSAAIALGFEIGKTYLNDYWKQRHTIIEAWMDRGWPMVRSKWADGHETVHCTQRSKADKEI